MVDRTPYRQPRTGQHQNTMTRKKGENNGGQNTIYTTEDWHHYFPLLSWSSCFGVVQSFVVYIVFCPPLFPPSFLVIVFWYCPVFSYLYGVLSTIIFPNTKTRRPGKKGENNGGQNTI
jgi:hypothetical protein